MAISRDSVGYTLSDGPRRAEERLGGRLILALAEQHIHQVAIQADQPGGVGSITTFPNTTTTQVHYSNGRLVTAMASATASDGFVYPKGLYYQIDVNGNGVVKPRLIKQGVIDPGPGVAVQMPSVVEDKQGNLGLTWMESSSTEYLSMWVGNVYTNGNFSAQPAAPGGGVDVHQFALRMDEHRVGGDFGELPIAGFAFLEGHGGLGTGRDITGIDHDSGHGRLLDQVRGHAFKHPPRSIVVTDAVFSLHGTPRLTQQGRGRLAEQWHIVGMHETEAIFPLDVCGLVAEQTGNRRTDVGDRPCGVDEVHQI
jgi:hypothetical protein